MPTPQDKATAASNPTDLDTNASPPSTPANEELPPAEPDSVFEETLHEAIHDPARSALWDQLEHMARRPDRARTLATAYRAVLANKLDRDLELDLVDRAVRFHDEWMDDPLEVTALLNKVLDTDPTARWAFDRISLKLTVDGQWDALLALYDKVIGNTACSESRLALLDEAAAIAKDCAGNPKRAVGYLQQVFEARPTDHRTSSALERLLKQQKRFSDLIDFWTARLHVLTGPEALTTRQQIASCWLEDLHDPNGALAAVEPLAADPRMTTVAAPLLEMIVASAASTMTVRARALELLGKIHDGTSHWRQVVRALESALLQVREDEQAMIHREIARRLISHDAHEEALGHLAALIAAEPTVWTTALLGKVLRGKLDEQVYGFCPVLDRDQGRRLVHLAAERAARAPATHARAIELCRKLIEDKPDDTRAIGSLAKLYSSDLHTKDLLELRKHELGLAADVPQRLSLRLQIAALHIALSDVPAAITTLRENLAEQANHEPTIDEIVRQLEGQKKYKDLASLLMSQAEAVEELGCEDLAVKLWMHAARISKNELCDLVEAVNCYSRAVDLRPSIEALDELANVCLQREQYSQAVSWLQRRLDITPDCDRTPTTVLLARAHVGAGHNSDALVCLQKGLLLDPASQELRGLLAGLHRAAEAWPELVHVLVEGANVVSDNNIQRLYLREAADVLQRGMHSPLLAVPVLEQLVQLEPGERSPRVALADALRTSGQLEKARVLAIQLVEEYGRHHPPERAALHLLLARVLRAQGKPSEAIKQLELGASIDLGNLSLQRLLGQVYRESGQLDKAERAYHALVLLLRRRSALRRGPLQEGDVGIAEVLFELHLVAKDLGDEDRANENLESAFDAASLDLSEHERFESALRASGNIEMLQRALERKLALANNALDRASALAEIASTQEQLGLPDRALSSLIQALRECPSRIDLYEKAQVLAQQTGEIDAYATLLEQASDAAQKDGNKELACRLLMQLGSLEENERCDLTRVSPFHAV